MSDDAINSLSAQGNGGSLLRFIETRDVLVAASRMLTPAAVFLPVEGESGGIVVDRGDLTPAVSAVSFESAARKAAVRVK